MWERGVTVKNMADRSLRSAWQLAIGVVIAAVTLHTWLVMGWIVPVTVSGSSMAPTLLGPHRLYRCLDCRREFAVGLDQLPLGDAANCPGCGQRRATAAADADQRGERLAIDRTAFAWREPRRWEVVVFRCPERSSELCVKRVVGLPGETISLSGGDVLVNGQFVRKSLAEQWAVRQLVCAATNVAQKPFIVVDGVRFSNLHRWTLVDNGRLVYRHINGGLTTDEFSYNQGAVPPVNQVTDIMLTFAARLAGDGRLLLAADNGAGACQVTVDFGRRLATLRRDSQVLAERSLPNVIKESGSAEWTFSLFDRQVLLVIGDKILLSEPWGTDQVSSGTIAKSTTPRPPFSIGVAGLSGEVCKLAVWRDVYFAVRHADGRQPGAIRGEATSWRLGPGEFFVLGDNAAISDDSRSWLSGPGIDAKLLIGKPLRVR
jgi:signal peptidase I